ncbi:Flp family type IVb pilin [Mycoplana dimorpha]|uniref:Pilus assembly protein Flp/PilA n=1 Tax=Mycoplana dimorpha TaxID=28320 RepID=A0A2T5BC88_MYCDI|nr:Flp family type IVb pilin [Mycoplana dimorpha]PTM96599.1 pilus assembly protein Flp/PilA [Mycoplana dimorpha]
MRMLKSFVADRSGATAVEYGLLAALISIGLLGGLGAFRDQLQTVFLTIRDAIVGAG